MSNNINNKPIIQQWVKGVDFKTILIIILGLLIAFIFLFNAGWKQNTGYTNEQVDAIKAIFEERILVLDTKNTQLGDSIVTYNETADNLRTSINERDGTIEDLERSLSREQKKINDLIKKREEIRDEIRGLDDTDLEGWWSEYFKIKENIQ